MKPTTAWSRLAPQITTRTIIILSALIVAFVYLLTANTGFNLADEGYLWYGTIQTALGQVPIRDFQSYEPGRYYWGALWFKLLGNDGILTLRISQAIFQFIGLTLGLLLLRRVFASWIPLTFAAIILVRWMFPTWKIYEPVILIAAIYVAVLLIEKNSVRRHLYAGIFVGLAAYFGRNHGLYCFVAYVLLTFYLSWTDHKRLLLQRLGALAAGIVLGYMPMLLMFGFVPDFFSRFIADLLFNLNTGTNLPLPVPWPWRHDYRSLGTREAVNRLTIGTLYLAVLAFYVFALARLFFKRKITVHPVLLACTFVGAIYLHYAFDRPEVLYLAWTIPPFILGLFALPTSFTGRVRKSVAIGVWVVLALFSITVLEMAQENYFTIKPKSFVKSKLLGRDGGEFERAMNAQGLLRTNVRGDSLWVLKDTATLIQNLGPFERELSRTNDNVLITPYFPGLYAVLRKPSPLREIYFLFPQPLDEQQKMIIDLEQKHVNWAFVCDHYVDNRPELKFEVTHAVLWNYILANFETAPANIDQNCVLMRRRTQKAQTKDGLQ
jgi:hypothetical protein